MLCLSKKQNMSWVIKRHLSKSGGNAIGMRIGRFNRFSSNQCQTLKQIAHSVPRTRQFKHYKQKHKSISKLHHIIDEYCVRKTLNIYFEWSAPSPTPIRAPWWKARKAYWQSWCDTYGIRIANNIFKNCNSYEDLRIKHPLGMISDIFPKKRFYTIIIKIINKNKKYLSLKERVIAERAAAISFTYNTIQICQERWISGPEFFQDISVR